MNEFCVVWDYEHSTLQFTTLEEALNENSQRMHKDIPPLGIVRALMSEEDAKQYVRAWASWLAERVAA